MEGLWAQLAGDDLPARGSFTPLRKAWFYWVSRGYLNTAGIRGCSECPEGVFALPTATGVGIQATWFLLLTDVAVILRRSLCS